MRIILTLSLSFLMITGLKAQPNIYQKDLAALKLILQKTPSYKTQIKGGRLYSYDSLYNRLMSDTITDPDSYKYFYNLSQLIFPLKDNHIGFYQLANYNKFRTKASIDSFVKPKEFSDYPIYSIDIDSLKTALTKKPADAIEGIYHYDRFYSVGLFQVSEGELIGVIVDSDMPLWIKGQVAIHLYEFFPHQYKAIYGHPLYKNFILQTNEKYRYQSLVNAYFYGSYSQSHYSKQLQQTDFVNLPQGAPRFQLKNLNEKVQYLLLRTFQADNSSISESNKFYDSVKNSLNKANLIVDLRNNGGGAKKVARKYVELLKKYSRRGHLYVLVNNETISQAEIVVLRLKMLSNITVLGQQTKGMLTYGSNYGKRVRLPSGKFEIYPTDMKGSKKLLQHENVGISPDLPLAESSDWVNQVVELINNN